MGSQILLPEVSNVSFDQTFKAFLGWWFTEQFERMGQVLFKAEGSNIREPVLFRLGGKGEKLCSNVLQNVAIKMTDHTKQS